MAGLLDQILVIDIEATCWKNSPPPPGQENEIIEIGICMLDVKTFERREHESILITPVRSEVSPFCTELTTLTMKQLENEGTTFEKALKRLKKRYRSKDRAWASYGDYDRKQFRRQCESFDVRYPFGPTHLNIKTLFAYMQGSGHEIGLHKAMGVMGTPFEGTHHRGVDDAWNAAAILAEILRRMRGFSE